MTYQPTNDDVPRPIDFDNVDDVRSWVEETARNRPWRPEFFKAFASQLRSHLIAPATIAELGSGPGFLAEEILQSCDIIRYCLVDFSEPMHELARERLSRFEGLTEYLKRDFRSSDWACGLSDCDAVVSMQAVHEVRHKRHVPTLYGHIFRMLHPGGYFLVADHYATDKNKRNPNLYLNPEEQCSVLSGSGFVDVTLILDKENLALYRARRPSAAEGHSPCG